MVILTQYHTEIQNREFPQSGRQKFPSIPHAPVPEVALYCYFEKLGHGDMFRMMW